MLTLAPPLASVTEVRPLCGWQDTILAQGQDGQQVHRHLINVQCQFSASHWAAKVGTDIPEHDRIPPKRVTTMRVTFRYAGKGTPMPYVLDQEDDE